MAMFGPPKGRCRCNFAAAPAVAGLLETAFLITGETPGRSLYRSSFNCITHYSSEVYFVFQLKKQRKAKSKMVETVEKV